MTTTDQHFMLHALRLAEQGQGRTWPNPTVGAVVVKDGIVVGVGRTGDRGAPHAEPIALKMAGDDAKGATLYVSLEPCAHQGKTPPCTEAVIASGIGKVVIACEDENPKVKGKGVAALKEAGITVTTGVCEKEARHINAGFFRRVTESQPQVNLKIATSRDGKINPPTGQGRWITGERARLYGHLLRATHDAVMTGIGTVLADDPLYTCRIRGLENCSPVRVVLDTSLKIPLESQLVKTARSVPVWVITASEDKEKIAALEKTGVRVFHSPAKERPDLTHVFSLLAKEGINRVLAEAGGRLTNALLEDGHVDALYWFRAPHTFGEAAPGIAVVPGGDVLASLPGCVRQDTLPLGEDVLEIYQCSPA